MATCEKKEILKHQFGVRYNAFNSLDVIYGGTTNNGALSGSRLKKGEIITRHFKIKQETGFDLKYLTNVDRLVQDSYTAVMCFSVSYYCRLLQAFPWHISHLNHSFYFYSITLDSHFSQLQTGLEANRLIFEDKATPCAPSARRIKKKKSKPPEKV